MSTETEKKYKRRYRAHGVTASGRLCTGDWGTTPIDAIDAFIKDHPRFKGLGRLETKMIEDFGDDNTFVVSDCLGWDTIATFSSIKELKTMNIEEVK